MTERFTIVENNKNYLRVDDKTKQKFYLNEKEVVDLLNDLSEENNELRAINSRQKALLDELKR